MKRVRRGLGATFAFGLPVAIIAGTAAFALRGEGEPDKVPTVAGSQEAHKITRETAIALAAAAIESETNTTRKPADRFKMSKDPRETNPDAVQLTYVDRTPTNVPKRETGLTTIQIHTTMVPGGADARNVTSVTLYERNCTPTDTNKPKGPLTCMTTEITMLSPLSMDNPQRGKHQGWRAEQTTTTSEIPAQKDTDATSTITSSNTINTYDLATPSVYEDVTPQGSTAVDIGFNALKLMERANKTFDVTIPKVVSNVGG